MLLHLCFYTASGLPLLSIRSQHRCCDLRHSIRRLRGPLPGIFAPVPIFRLFHHTHGYSNPRSTHYVTIHYARLRSRNHRRSVRSNPIHYDLPSPLEQLFTKPSTLRQFVDKPTTVTVAVIVGVLALIGITMSIISKLLFVSAIFLGPLFLLPFAFMFFTILFPIAFGGLILYGTTGHGLLPGWFLWAVAGGVVYQVWQRWGKHVFGEGSEKSVKVASETSWEEEEGKRVASEMHGFDERLYKKTGVGLGGVGEVGTRLGNQTRMWSNKAYVANWTVGDVANRLREEGFGAYAGAFMAERIDGSVLLELTEDDFYEIDGKYVPLGDRKRLTAFVNELKEVSGYS